MNRKSIILMILFVSNIFSASDSGSILKEVTRTLSLDNVVYTVDMKIVRNRNVSQYQIAMWSADGAYSGVVHSPAADRGTVFLNRDGYTWAYYPEIQKRVKYSQKQKMLGSDFSFSDVAGIDLIHDYTVDNEKQMKIDELPFALQDGVRQMLSSGNVLRLECKAAEGVRVNYPMVRLYTGVYRGANIPLAIEYYTLSGAKIGMIEYYDFQDMGRGYRPRKMKAASALGNESYSEMYYRNMKFDQKIPGMYFTEAYMQKLSTK